MSEKNWLQIHMKNTDIDIGINTHSHTQADTMAAFNIHRKTTIHVCITQW